MLNIDLGKIVTQLGENTIADIGEPLGLSPELSMKAARSLAENFHGNADDAINAAAAETGIGKDVLEAMILKLREEARSQAVDHVKEQAATGTKGIFGKFFDRYFPII